jgi:2-oxoisovalerate dehydrogenase E2 component (dihydrolipoyl transacylase)
MSVERFALPDLGEGLEDAEITEWHVLEGETITLNQPLLTVETAKAEVEVPSPFAGVVMTRHGDVGEVVLVGRVLVEIETGDPGSGTGRRSPVLVGYGAAVSEGPRRRRRSTVNAARVGAASPSNEWGVAPRAPHPLAKPPIRLLARTLGVELAGIVPTGTHGTITRDDVTRAAAATTPTTAGTEPAAGGREIPIRGVRRATAERMSTSRREIPDSAAALWVDFTALMATRRTLRDTPPHGPEVTPFALLCRLVVEALLTSPALNATFDEAAGVIRHFEPIHLGFAVSTDRGLVVPVARDAQAMSTSELAHEMKRLAEAARSGSATPAELQGSTFSITNFGSFGVDDGNPIINHPEAAIVGVGAIKDRPWVDGGELTVRSTAKLTCAFDHRVSDGAEASAFLTTLRDMIESGVVPDGPAVA